MARTGGNPVLQEHQFKNKRGGASRSALFALRVEPELLAKLKLLDKELIHEALNTLVQD